MNWAEFLAMGGYAIYVWPSWLLAVIIFAWHLLQPSIKRKHLIEQARKQQARERFD